MASIQTGIELQDDFTGVLYGIINSVSLAVSAMYDMQESMNADIDMRGIEGAIEEINQVTAAINEMNEALDSQAAPYTPVEAPVSWETDGMEVFTSTGVDRFRQEVQSVNSMLEQLGSTQDAIARQAYNTNLFPPESFQDLNSLAVRIDNIGERIRQIEDNPVNLGTDTANAELEQLRAQLDSMIREQNELNEAMQDMDVSAANDAYLRLSRLVSGTEQYIRDNVDEQGRFNEQIQEGVDCAEDLNSVISKAVAAFAGIFGVSEIIGFVSDGMDAFNTQLNAETQLMSVLANMLDDDYVMDYLIETAVTADVSDAVSEINGIQGDVNDVEISVVARTDALQAEFDSIIARADEISSKGIYGGDSLIAGAAELSTYFTDTDAVEMMMDTLSDYAMGMSGGGELDTAAMVEYATGLGKIMSGAYDAMTKKGFEFTEVQQDIIEGTATQEQIAAVLGEEYLDMSDDMRAAAVITQVIDESWAGLYETMSNTPEGKIIQLTNAWGDMKAMIAGQLYPYILLVVDTITSHWGTIQTVIDGFSIGLQNIMAVLGWLIGGVMDFASLIADNWSIISPIIMGIVAALAAYAGYLAIVRGIEIASIAVKGALAVAEFIHVAALAAQTGATISATAAQLGLNGAMYACPIVWVIMLIIALIAVIFAVCNAIAKMTGVADSGFGVMTGGINVVIQFFKNLGLSVANIALGIGNATAALANNMMTAFHNAICSVQSWFYNLLSTALSVIAGICEALNNLPFVEFDYSGLTSAADNYAAKAAEAVGNKEDYQSISEAFNNGFSTFETFQDGWVSDAFNAGAAWGDGIAEAVSNFSLTDALGLDIGSAEDYEVSASDYSSILNSGIGSSIDDIAGNTGAIRDSLDISTEELKYLRDIAEQESINKLTTAEIKIDMSGMQNTVNNGMDLDGVISSLTDGVNEAIEIMAEGVHK